MRIAQLLFIALLAYCCLGHSWLACSDYRPTTQQNSVVYDNSRCFGFPRNWQNFAGSTFGEDRGYNFQGTGCGSQNARGSPISAAYTTTYPMGTWVAGSTVCLAWPSKNHVAAATTNPFIPDNGMKLFRSAPDQDTDPAQSVFSSNLVVEFGPHVNGQIDYKGFQNCSGFDQNNDKSMCLGCFTVPANLAAGVYTFQWYWIFNQGSAPYTTCFDARVVASGGNVADPCTGITCKNGGTCSQGKCTCVNNFSGTYCDVAPGQTAAPNPTQPPGNLPGGIDSILDYSWPTEFGSSSFQVYMRYNAAGDRALVVDILKLPNFDFYGKGFVYVTAGQGTATITITPQNNPAPGTGYVLKGWIVAKATFDQNQATAYTAELDKVIRDTSYRAAATPTLPALPTSTPTKKPSSSVAVTFSALFLGLILAISCFF